MKYFLLQKFLKSVLNLSICVKRTSFHDFSKICTFHLTLPLQEKYLCGVFKWSFYRANLIFVTKGSALRIFMKVNYLYSGSMFKNSSESEECENTKDKPVKYAVKSERKTNEPSQTCKISLCTINVCISMTFRRFH